jgi:hypothetical protein
MLLIIMWATGFTKAWKTSSTIFIGKNKGYETGVVTSYHPIGLAYTLYKLWTRLITNTLYEHADSASQKPASANTKIPFTNSKT